MRTEQGFLAAAAVLAFSFALGGRAVAGSPSDFTFSRARVLETIETFETLPVSCEDFPASSDTYDWQVKLAHIKGDFTQDLANNILIEAFNSGSCSSINNVTNTLLIPPGAALIHANGDGTVDVDFTGAVPDFSIINTSNDINLPFFDNINFHMVYNASLAIAQGLAPGAGTLELSGNANLCAAITSMEDQCFILDLNYLDYLPNQKDFACICVKPTLVDLDITPLLE